MAIIEPNNLFPLPLTAFERFMLADDSPDFPMAFFLQVRLKGVVDRTIYELAIAEALSRHPLLCCRVEKNWRGARWIWAGTDTPAVDWNRNQWISEEPWQRPINLTKNVGLRVWAEQHASHAIITFQFHHACCDGIGAAQFLVDVAISYARHHASLTGSTTELPSFQPLNLELLKQRDSTQGRRIANVPGSIFRRARIVAKHTVRYLRQQKLPLLVKETSPQDERQRGPGLLALKLGRDETRKLREAARRHNASLNDLLVRDLMLTAHSWNTKLGGEPRHDSRWKQPTICVLVPTSLRGPADGALPACNVVSYIFMAKPLTLVKRPDELLTSIRDEMKLIHKYQAGWLFIQALKSLEKLPGMLRLIMMRTRNKCMSTTVLSHLGNIHNAMGSRLPRQDDCIQMGNLLIEEINGTPPIRQGTATAFATMIIRGQLAINIRCCGKRFSNADRQDLLNQFSERLKQTANCVQVKITGKLLDKSGSGGKP